MIADMFSNKKLNLGQTELFIRGRKVKNLCFYNTILFCCVKKYYSKSYASFYYENYQQTRPSTNCI